MIHYQTYGHADSQPVILLHSGGMAGEEWQPQIAPPAQRYRLLHPDQPGHGKSPPKAYKAPTSVAPAWAAPSPSGSP